MTADAARPAMAALPAFSTFSTKAGFAAEHITEVLLVGGGRGGRVSDRESWNARNARRRPRRRSASCGALCIRGIARARHARDRSTVRRARASAGPSETRGRHAAGALRTRIRRVFPSRRSRARPDRASPEPRLASVRWRRHRVVPHREEFAWGFPSETRTHRLLVRTAARCATRALVAERQAIFTVLELRRR